jgi:hypothetical protein
MRTASVTTLRSPVRSVEGGAEHLTQHIPFDTLAGCSGGCRNIGVLQGLGGLEAHTVGTSRSVCSAPGHGSDAQTGHHPGCAPCACQPCGRLKPGAAGRWRYQAPRACTFRAEMAGVYRGQGAWLRRTGMSQDTCLACWTVYVPRPGVVRGIQALGLGGGGERPRPCGTTASQCCGAVQETYNVPYVRSLRREK